MFREILSLIIRII